MKLSLNKPVRISVDNMNQTAKNLVQEFVRIRHSHKQDRDAVLLGKCLHMPTLLIPIALCSRTFKSNVIVFFKKKVDAHRMKILFSLLGLEAAELHGNMSQVQVCLYFIIDFSSLAH